MYTSFVQEMPYMPHYRACPLSPTERSVLGNTMNWVLKITQTGGRQKVSATKKFYCESLTVILSIPEKSVCYREVSAIKDIRYKGVSQYLQ